MIFPKNKKKGQSALEFTIIIGFALVIVTGLLIVFQSLILDSDSVREEETISQFYNLILSEIDFAEMSYPVYNRVFYLPRTIGGFTYNLTLHEEVELALGYRGVTHVRFLTESIYGDFNISRNVIIKNESGIYLNPS